MQPVLHSIYSPDIDANPVGDLGLVAGLGGELLRIDFLRKHRSIPHWTDALAARDLEPSRDDVALEPVRDQLAQYFVGERKTFDLDLAPAGGAFESSVWNQLQCVPWGSTWTYGQLADAVGEEAVPRAVGGAVGRNPIPIVIPCHRVIGADGSLVGYGGGLEVKEWLLLHEGSLLCPLPKGTSGSD